jgi:hypothetical protein
MDKIALLLKSYSADLDYARRLLASFNEMNTQGLTLHCVVPESDIHEFGDFASGNVLVHSEETLLGDHLVESPLGDLSVGYANQEIVKLAFWETGFAENYFCIDSDAVLLRPFGAEDFMRDEHTPYSVLVEDKELLIEPSYFKDHWVGREKSIRLIMNEVDLQDPIMRTSHGHQIFSARVLRSFKEEFLTPRGWTYADALLRSPYEFSWYAMWLQKSQVIPVHQREPLMKVFHNEDQHLAAILSGITDADIARGYLGVVVNSNFSRGVGMLATSDSKPEALAPYLSYGELRDLALAKAKDTWKRRRASR